MIQVLDWLAKHETVTDCELNNYLSHLFSDYDEQIYKDCLSYLTNITNVLLEINVNLRKRKA